MIKRLVAVNDPGPVVAPGNDSPSLLSHVLPETIIIQQDAELLGQGAVIPAGHKKPVHAVLNQLWIPPYRRGHHREARGHILQDGVAEALRIRQATQSASIYSIYLSAVSAIRKCLELICTWGGYNKDDLDVDAPSTLTFGTPDADLIRELASGNTNAVYPLSTVHRYLISAGMLDQTVSFEEYVDLLMADQGIKRKLKAVMEAYGTTDLSFSTEETGDITTNTEDSGGKVNTNKTSKYSPVNNPGLEGL